MNQPREDRRNFWLKGSLLALVALNLVLLASIWVPRLKAVPEGGKAGIGAREREVVQQFLERSLELSAPQKEAAARLRADHFQQVDPLRREINDLRRQILQEAFAVAPDREKAARLAARLGQEQARFDLLTFDHFSALFGLCRPGQKEKLRSLMGELLERQKPPRPNAGLRPGAERPGPQSGLEPSSPDRERAGEDAGSGGGELRRNQTGPLPPSGQGAGELARVGEQLERWRGRLGLSADQVRQLRPIAEAFARQIDDCRARRAGDREEKAVKDRRDGAIAALLSAEQKVRFEQMIREGREPDRSSPEE